MGWASNLATGTLAAGSAIILSADATDVKIGGGCLMATAAILADLQNGRRFGYTDKLLAGLRKAPGFEKAEEGELLGLLCFGACAFLGGGETMRMASRGRLSNLLDPGWINQCYNYLLYPVGGALGFNAVREKLKRVGVPETITYSHTTESGERVTSEPVNTFDLLQQAAFLLGAGGITAFGTALDAPAIQTTGALFMTGNALNIAEKLTALAKRQPPLDMTGTLAAVADEARALSDPPSPIRQRE